jgi:LPS export ABC transporter protein LptC
MSPRRIAKLLGLFGASVLTVILVITIVVVKRREGAPQLAARALGLAPGALLHAHNFHWTQMRGDQRQWVLKARDANYSDDKTTLTLVKPQLSMRDRDGKRVDLVADLATLKLDGNHIKQANMQGGLIVHYGDFTLATDSASFEPDSDELTAPGPVRITGRDLTVTGIGLKGHPKAETFELQKQVSTEIIPRHTSDSAKPS